MKHHLCSFGIACISLLSAFAFGEDACERLAAAKIPNTTITLAQTAAAGTFKGPPAPFSEVDISALYKSLPAFCRVVAEAADLRMEWQAAGHRQWWIRRLDR
jgi:hypothetical protein